MKEITLDIQPFKAVGVLQFGKSRDEIRKIMSDYDKVDTFTRNKFSEGPTDGYYNSSLFLDYTADDKLCCITVTDLEVTYNNTILNILDLAGLKKLGQNTDNFVDGTLFIDKIGVLIGFEYEEEEDDKYEQIESILIASKQEYEELIQIYKEL